MHPRPPGLTLSVALCLALVTDGRILETDGGTTDGAAEAWCLTVSPECECSTPGHLNCRSTRIGQVPADLPENLIKIDLAGNNITSTSTLQRMQRLEELYLDDNSLTTVEPETFSNIRSSLTILSLSSNRLCDVPRTALAGLINLHTLNLDNNCIERITSDTLPPLNKLKHLSLSRNKINTIDIDAFNTTPDITLLELDDNVLKEVPEAITSLQHLNTLTLSGNRITNITVGILQRCRQLTLLILRSNNILTLHVDTFTKLPSLRTLILSDSRHLSELPSFNGSSYIETLRLDRCSIHTIPGHVCTQTPYLKTLDIKSNKLSHIPDLNACKELRVLDLSYNYIKSIDANTMAGLNKLHDLVLSYNHIVALLRNSFHGLQSLQLLDLEGNHIEFIHHETFLQTPKLDDLNLANNYFPYLPSNGLERLLHLKTYNNPNLKEFHKPEVFPRIQTLYLSYAYHCCPYMSIMKQHSDDNRITETVYFPNDKGFDLKVWRNLTNVWPRYEGPEFGYSVGVASYSDDYNDRILPSDFLQKRIHCLPLPGPFLPCHDLFDWWTLRCGVWVVFLMAMLGNGTVVFVLIFSRSKMDVPRFLVCNLAAADFFMGIYLGFLAVVDASTLGEFKKYAIAWQMSPACRLAGFLGVLSSELSVYTLAVITLERNYAITHAMHLNKRLSLRHAAYVMLVGWCCSIICAALPLFGVSDYRKFAVCLPFETEGTQSLGYVVFLMFANGIAFLVLMGCYLKMYCAIRGSQAWNSNDSRIAKRMALLVFTDFLCWSPIAFFSLTAAFGLRLVSLEQAKVFTVFVLPLNSCCNPFLYAILTKQFKKDCVLICKAIEESRVTRGIGRCRHSSNFSNRQTPANTDSFTERSSKDKHAPHCACKTRLIQATSHAIREPTPRKVLRWLKSCGKIESRRQTVETSRARTTGAVQPPQRGNTRIGSVSSSENLSSSRSDSWKIERDGRNRLPRIPRRPAQWSAARKTSQDSNLSSSRNDSSGSATTASTGTWRSRSSGRPRLTRQLAVLVDEPPASPARLAVRFLATIPSAAETSFQLDEDDTPQCVLHQH